MSQDGPPPPGPDQGRPSPEDQPEQQPEQPGTHAAPPPEAPGYNPYPDNWTSAPTGNPAFNVAAPPPPPPADTPYGQPAAYAAQPPGANPYAGPNAGPGGRPTFGFGGYAGWFTRVGAALVDGLIGALVGIPATLGIVLLFSDTTTTTSATGTSEIQFHQTWLPIALIVIGWLLSLAFTIWNVYIRQGNTGATLGKSVLAIRLVNADLQPIGPGWAFLRQILHVVDSLPCGLGYLNPIWDPHKQTFADKIMRTYVIQATTPQERPFR